METEVIRRRPPGRNGGRPVGRRFYFTRADGDKYPSESESIRTNREPVSPNHQQSWAWALNHMVLNDLWLVVPLDPTKEYAGEANRVRAAVFRTANRNGVMLASQYIRPNLYIKVVER